jgi:hypothetical protein
MEWHSGILNPAHVSKARHGAPRSEGVRIWPTRLTIENGLLSIAFDGVGNLFQEFVFRKMSSGAGKP